VTGIDPVGHPIHNNGLLFPPQSIISATCNLDHLTTKTNQYPMQNFTRKGMIFTTAAAITGNNANSINSKAIGMIG
jgi:hypothetical protein